MFIENYYFENEVISLEFFTNSLAKSGVRFHTKPTTNGLIYSQGNPARYVHLVISGRALSLRCINKETELYFAIKKIVQDTGQLKHL